jgi:hypothetical protein
MKQINLFRGGSSTVEPSDAVRGDSGSSPTPPLQLSTLRLEQCAQSEADEWYIKYHYLHRKCPGGRVTFRLTMSGRIVGYMTYTYPGAIMQYSQQYLELKRMYVIDEAPRNVESKALSISVRLIRKMFPHITALISYADPARGHQGTIYKAAGWCRAGLSDCSGQWRNHPTRKTLEAPTPKIKYVKTIR